MHIKARCFFILNCVNCAARAAVNTCTPPFKEQDLPPAQGLPVDSDSVTITRFRCIVWTSRQMAKEL